MSEPEQFQCPRCSGAGWLHVRGGHWGRDKLWVNQDSFPDCPECEGTGVRTADEIEAYFSRLAG